MRIGMVGLGRMGGNIVRRLMRAGHECVVYDANLATAFKLNGVDWAATLISIGALAGLTTVVMVLILGQIRVLFAMSRDRLLPHQLAKTGEHGTPALLSTRIQCSLVSRIVRASISALIAPRFSARSALVARFCSACSSRSASP